MRDYTSDLLCTTLRELMKKKSIRKVRISELCELCQIERSTFYYHFKDKYDLVAHIYLQDMEGLDILDPVQAAVGMENMRIHIQYYQNAFRDFPENSFLQYLQNYYYTAYLGIIETRIGAENLSHELRFHLKLYLTGSTVMSMKWFFEKDPIPAVELMQLIYGSMPETIKNLLKPQETLL